MSIPILVVTPSEHFGTVIRRTLSDAGDYEIMLAASGRQAVVCAGNRSFALAIIDADPVGVTLTTLANALRALEPDLGLIFLAAKEVVDAAPPPLIGPADYLPKPFTGQDLIALTSQHTRAPLEKARETAAPDASPAGHELPDWLHDQGRAAQHLIRLSLEASAQAALITRGNALWAYAGGLSQTAAEELARRVSRYAFLGNTGGLGVVPRRSGQGRLGDVARFVHLESTGQDLLLYATNLKPGLVLAMAFAPETPFGQIRMLAGRLARALAIDSERDPAKRSEAPVSLLEALPPPLASHSETGEHLLVALPLEEPPITVQPPTSESFDTQPPGESVASPVQDHEVLIPVPPRPAETAGQTLLPPPGLLDLCFAAALTPRMPQHHLTGELLTLLGDWMRQLCTAYGWRLEYISIRPVYLTWVCRVQAETAPGEMICHFRSQTSQRIFAAFPNLAAENPSGDFWAPGALLISSSTPPAADILNRYIEATRQQQGATGA